MTILFGVNIIVLLRIVLLAILGLAVGWGTGAGSVFLERREKLEEEEAEDRKKFDEEVEAARKAAVANEEPEPETEEWISERYGWTWLERWVSPIATGLLFGVLGAASVVWYELAIQLLWVAVLVHIAIFDFKHRLVLDVISYPAIVLALIASFFTPYLTFLWSLAGAGFIGIFFLLPAIIKRGSVGLGDVKLGLFIGAITGFWVLPLVQGAMVALFWGVALAAVVSLALLVTRRVHLHDGIAYAPYLCLGGVIALFFWQRPMP